MMTPDEAIAAIDALENMGQTLADDHILFRSELGKVFLLLAEILRDQNTKLETLGSVVLKMHGFAEEA